MRRNGKDGRPRARTGACTPARDEKRECPRDEVRGIAREEKLRFTDRGTVTKRKWSSRERERERRKVARRKRGIQAEISRVFLSPFKLGCASNFVLLFRL